MNKPATVHRSPAHEEDGYGWAMAQARLNRERRIEDIDRENIKSRRDEMRRRAYRRARIEAARETDLPLETFAETPLDWSVILDQPFSTGGQ